MVLIKLIIYYYEYVCVVKPHNVAFSGKVLWMERVDESVRISVEIYYIILKSVYIMCHRTVTTLRCNTPQAGYEMRMTQEVN